LSIIADKAKHGDSFFGADLVGQYYSGDDK
jgi:hypothetical protein